MGHQSILLEQKQIEFWNHKSFPNNLMMIHFLSLV